MEIIIYWTYLGENIALWLLFSFINIFCKYSLSFELTVALTQHGTLICA